MRRLTVVLLVLGFLVVTVVRAADAPTALVTAMGDVQKAEKESLTLQTRTPDGKFGKKLVLKVTGTTKLSQLSHEKRSGKLVPVQRDLDLKDLEPGQAIAVIYTESGSQAILLAGVVERPAASK